MKSRILVAAVLSALAIPAAAGAKTITIPAPGPGPAATDRVFVTKYGSASAKRVLVLVPGTNGGAGNFAVLGPDIVKRVPGLQVWAFDRRSENLEDRAGFAAGNPDTAFGYYFKQQSIDGRKFDLGLGGTALYGADWGLLTQINDLRRVSRSPVTAAGAPSSSAGTRSAPPRPSPTRPGTSPAGPATRTSPVSC